MIFNSFQYALFLPLVLAVHWLARSHRRQNVVLLVASYVFYAAWDVRFLGLMLLTTAVDFTVGRQLGRLSGDRARRRLLTVSLVANLGVLGTFKYLGFFADSASALLGRVGVHADIPTLKVLLPVGISFYTFHGISYTVDVYRRHVRPTSDLLAFAVFVAYFPQLVAGPIGRADAQLPQFARPRPRVSRDDVATGASLILLGLVKKVVIADSMARVADYAFLNPAVSSSLTLVAGATAFSLQIYGDFSGYTDMARGSSMLFGIELPVNFSQPYLSRDITEFWRRWHISLSRWLRDYLYIPLGGNHGGRLAVARNLMVTMLLGGLWHGAQWTFVLWGGVHGALLVAHRWWGRARDPERPLARSQVPAIAVTFAVVTLVWVLFRAESLSQALAVYTGIVSLRGGISGVSVLLTVVPMLALTAGIDLSQRRSGQDAFVRRLRPAARGALYGSALVAVVALSGAAAQPFIYFQF